MKVFIKQSIEKAFGRRIIKTQLIYAMDTLNTLNMHKYVDKKENLIVIIKLVNGNFLAAFT